MVLGVPRKNSPTAWSSGFGAGGLLGLGTTEPNTGPVCGAFGLMPWPLGVLLTWNREEAIEVIGAFYLDLLTEMQITKRAAGLQSSM